MDHRLLGHLFYQPEPHPVVPSHNMQFYGVYINRSDGGLNTNQRPYIDRQMPLTFDANLVLLWHYGAQLSWLIHSLPNVFVMASKLAQVTDNLFSISHVKQYNTTMRYLQDKRHLSLRMCKTDPESLRVRAMQMHHSVPTLITRHSSSTSY